VGLLLASEARGLQALGGDPDDRDADGLLLLLLDRPEWPADPRIAAALREPLSRLCARYLLQARAPSGRAADPVAHFHLSNGARVERLNWLGDTSAKGLQQAAGLMVNYLYRLDHIETNHEAYREEGRVAASSALRTLVRAA
jgi:malonyl-CoA decarboxylase